MLGFAALAEINTTRAAEAFRRAIQLDQANPMPRFGLGLATIRDGRLREGRADIESAVLLDPNNSLLRSYLGKAYFEERTTNPLKYFRELVENFPNQENRLAAEQYALAKQLDPNDPTPWFYDAIRKQSENRPVEALARPPKVHRAERQPRRLPLPRAARPGQGGAGGEPRPDLRRSGFPTAWR